MNYALEVSNLTKFFRIYHERNQSLKATITKGRRTRHEEFAAVQNVSFKINEGSTFGIIGSNGSGKSTLLKCLAGILTPDAGTINSHGRIVALLELGAGFHPELSGRENISLNGAILGMTQIEIREKFDSIVEFAGLERFIDMPVKNYSSGMVVRLGFAIAINVDPEILIIDEVLAVGDEQFQRKCYEKIDEFCKSGKTVILVSHGLSMIEKLCDQVLWMESGIAKMQGETRKVVAEYLVANKSGIVEKPKYSGMSSENGNRVRLSNVAISDAHEDNSGIFSSGSQFQIVFGLTTIDYVGSAYVQLKISTLDGTLVWQNGTDSYEVVFDTTNNIERLVTCRIPSIPILEGIFQVSVTISNHSGSLVMDHVEDAARFNVVKTNFNQSGILLIEPQWTIK
jgi:ABC-2 type transport system ATP-binding protein